MLPGVSGAELLILAAVALVVVGPKDLPMLMRKVGQMVTKARGMAADFRSSFDEMARQAELDDLRKEVEQLRQTRVSDVVGDIDVETGVQDTMRQIESDLHGATHELPSALEADTADLPPPAPTYPLKAEPTLVSASPTEVTEVAEVEAPAFEDPAPYTPPEVEGAPVNKKPRAKKAAAKA